ncbi:MAG: hypothetical protein WAW26_21275, partial [Anaerolineae bacterium]
MTMRGCGELEGIVIGCLFSFVIISFFVNLFCDELHYSIWRRAGGCVMRRQPHHAAGQSQCVTLRLDEHVAQHLQV